VIGQDLEADSQCTRCFGRVFRKEHLVSESGEQFLESMGITTKHKNRSKTDDLLQFQAVPQPLREERQESDGSETQESSEEQDLQRLLRLDSDEEDRPRSRMSEGIEEMIPRGEELELMPEEQERLFRVKRVLAVRHKAKEELKRQYRSSRSDAGLRNRLVEAQASFAEAKSMLQSLEADDEGASELEEEGSGRAGNTRFLSRLESGVEFSEDSG